MKIKWINWIHFQAQLNKIRKRIILFYKQYSLNRSANEMRCWNEWTFRSFHFIFLNRRIDTRFRIRNAFTSDFIVSTHSHLYHRHSRHNIINEFDPCTNFNWDFMTTTTVMSSHFVHLFRISMRHITISGRLLYRGMNMNNHKIMLFQQFVYPVAILL